MNNLNFRASDFLTKKEINLDKKMVIAIDGPAGSGKSTLSKKLAARLSYSHLNTGALYRAVGLALYEIGGDPDSDIDVKSALNIIQKNLTPQLLSNPALRTQEIARLASQVASIPMVRDGLLESQREFALNPDHEYEGSILEGRDIGTVVCPDADIKLFVIASPEIRAKRRVEELQSLQKPANYEQVLAEIIERDDRDSNREIAPLKAADDAFTIDTSGLSPSEVVDHALNVIKSEFVKQTS